MELRDSAAFGKGRTITLTILGKSGSGKTVFLSSMYHHLAEGSMGFSVAATNDKTDRVLGGAIEDLILKKEVPAGTTENSLTYGFCLKFNGQPIADIDCFDYRGGAIDDEAESEAGAILSKRIANSDIVMWLIDLSEIPEGELFSGKSRLKTRLRRLNSICSQAIKADERPRVWSFVRAKVDVNFPDLASEDLKVATTELLTHLGGALTISTHDSVPYANVVSIAPIGKVSLEGDEIVAGDEVINVEWPLLTSVGMLIKARLAALDEQIEAARKPEPESRGGFFSPAQRDRREDAHSHVASEAEREREFLTAVDGRITAKVPNSVIVVQPNDVAGSGGE